MTDRHDYSRVNIQPQTGYARVLMEDYSRVNNWPWPPAAAPRERGNPIHSEGPVLPALRFLRHPKLGEDLR